MRYALHPQRNELLIRDQAGRIVYVYNLKNALPGTHERAHLDVALMNCDPIYAACMDRFNP